MISLESTILHEIFSGQAITQSIPLPIPHLAILDQKQAHLVKSDSKQDQFHGMIGNHIRWFKSTNYPAPYLKGTSNIRPTIVTSNTTPASNKTNKQKTSLEPGNTARIRDK